MTAIFLRPVATDAAGNWLTDAAGTDLHTAIDEATRDDDDFIRSGDNPSADLCRVKLAIDGAGEIAVQGGDIWTIFANENDRAANSESETAGDTGWDEAVAGTGTTTYDSNIGFPTISIVTLSGYSSNFHWVSHSLLEFDTSGVAAVASDVAVVANVTSSEGACIVELRAYDWSPASGDNFVPGGDLSSLTLLASGTAFEFWNDLGIKTLATGSGVTVPQSSTFRCVLSTAEHRLGTRPADGEGLEEPDGTPPTGAGWRGADITAAESAGTSLDPRLIVDQRTAPVTIRYTVGKAGPDAATVTINHVVRLVQNSITIAEWTHSNVSATLALQEQGLTAAEADEVDWPAVNDDTLPLFLEFVATKA